MRRHLAGLLREMAAAVAPKRTHFVRVGRGSFSETCKIVHAAHSDGPLWPDQLVASVRDFLLEEQGQDMSIYAVDTPSPFDAAHALGVLAGTISKDEFQARKREEYLRRLHEGAASNNGRKGSKPPEKDVFGATKVVSFILPRELLGGCALISTPHANANFAPADELHHDAKPSSVDAFARRLLDGIRQGHVLCTFLKSEAFRVQAAIALSACIRRFGSLAAETPPKTWRDGESLSAAEQLERLRTIAGHYGFQSRLDYNRPGAPG